MWNTIGIGTGQRMVEMQGRDRVRDLRQGHHHTQTSIGLTDSVIAEDGSVNDDCQVVHGSSTKSKQSR